jgi:hypothetical protein
LSYCSRPDRPPKPPYGGCDDAIKFTRLRESWQLSFAPAGEDPEFDSLGAGPEPSPFDPGFVAAMERARWPVFIGQVRFGPDALNPVNHVLDFTGIDAARKLFRREIGTDWVAASPQVHIRAASAPVSLAAGESGVDVRIDGSASIARDLVVARDAAVEGTVAVGSADPNKPRMVLAEDSLTVRGPGGKQLARIWVESDKLNMTVGGGAAAQLSIDSAGVLTVQTINSPTAKQFRVRHPQRRGASLAHACVEGPEAAVYYRGDGQLSGGRAVVPLPSYFEQVARRDGRTVQVTPRFCTADEPVSTLAASDVAGGAFTVRALDDRNPEQQFYWEVKAVRADVPPLEVESTDS